MGEGEVVTVPEISDPESTDRGSPNQQWKWVVVTSRRVVLYMGLPLLCVVVFNALRLYIPAKSVLSDDHRNKTVSVAVYHRWGIVPSEIVFDLRNIRGDTSRADVTRMLFQVAEAFEDRDYEWVFLAYKGKAKLKLDGEQFKEIGETFSYQNPVYLMRKLPQHIYYLDGRRVFGVYTGGWLGVASAELSDLNQLHDKWWWEEDIFN